MRLVGDDITQTRRENASVIVNDCDIGSELRAKTAAAIRHFQHHLKDLVGLEQVVVENQN